MKDGLAETKRLLNVLAISPIVLLVDGRAREGGSIATCPRRCASRSKRYRYRCHLGRLSDAETPKPSNSDWYTFELIGSVGAVLVYDQNPWAKLVALSTAFQG